MKISVCASFVVLASLTAAVAAPLPGVDRVQFANRQVILFPTGKVLKAPDVVAMPFNIVIKTNGTFTVNNGKTRTLEEGDILGSDGTLLKPNGSITPVLDHVTLNQGQVLVVKDGEAIQPNDVVTLGNNTTIAPDWKVTLPEGNSRRLMDGEVFRLGGNSFPARDTITMQNGRVMVQKDGSMLEVDPTRTIMMNEGTKVYGDGRIVSFSGEQSAVSEGQIYIVQGVVRLPR
jgi:hypothetical protein